MPRLPSLCLTLALLASLSLPAAEARVFDPRTFTLANGMEVVVVEDHRAPVVTHMVWYRVGAADEPPLKSGIAHFLEHLMFKGTPGIPPGEFSRIVARNGGRDNAFTAQDYTGYFQDVAKDRLELVMRMEADRMVNLVLTDELVLPERQVVLEERSQRTDNNPRALLGEQMQAMQFLAHPYRIPVIGWEHEIRQLTRQDALEFYRRHYAPNNAILIVAGDVTADEVRQLAERHYGPIPRREIAPRLRPQEPPQLAERRVSMEDQRVREPSWSRSYVAPAQKAGEAGMPYALTVLAEILGGGRTSRMQRALVLGDGPASSAGAWYDGTALDYGRFGLYATPKNGVGIEKLEAAMERVIAEIQRDGVTDAELARAKAGLEAAAIYARDSMSNAARTLGAALTSGLTVADVEAWPERIAAVTREDVQAAAREVLDLRRSVTGILLPKVRS
ncbi:MAG: insulinase family protein [Alphaproteobacteria bacterium]|nr:insulinase family protein [Alphaproteobacteria bacterium]